MSTCATPIRKLPDGDERRSPRKVVANSGLVTVEMCPAGFGLLLDVSKTGVGVYTLTSLKCDQDVQVIFSAPGFPGKIEAIGKVRWALDSHAGLKLEKIRRDGFETLNRWIETLPDAPNSEDPAAQRGRSTAFDRQLRALEDDIRPQPLGTALQFIATQALEMMNASGAAIALGNQNNMVCRASAGIAPDIGVAISNSGLTGECVKTSKLVHCEDTEVDSRVDREVCRQLNLRSTIIAPIVFNNDLCGVLEVFSPVEKAFNDQHVALMQRVANLIAQKAYGAAEPALNLMTEPAAAPAAVTGHPPKTSPPPAETRIEAAPMPEELVAIEPEGRRNLNLVIDVVAILLIALLLLWLFRSHTPPQTTSSPSPSSEKQAPMNVQPVALEETLKPISATPKLPPKTPAPHTIRVVEPITTEVPLLRSNGPIAKSSDIESGAAPLVELPTDPRLPGVSLPASPKPALRQPASLTGGKLLYRAEPEYPTQSLRQRVQGDVVLSARITSTGTVDNIRQLKGNPLLGSAAIDAVRKWRYEPFTRGGVAQEMKITITLQFRIPDRPWRSE